LKDIINSGLVPNDHLKIGFITCVHPFYDLPPVARQRQEAITELRRTGCEVLAADTPRTVSEAVEIAVRLRDSAIDVVVLFFCTWVAEEIPLALAGELRDVPMLIWALPYLDKDIPMPSPISGLVASASNIRRSGKQFVWLIGQVTPDQVRQVAGAARAAKVAGDLRRARFGMVGSACPGMLDVVVDEADLQKALGVTAIHIDLDVLLEAARAASPVDAAAAAQRVIAQTGGAIEIGEQALVENLRFYPAIRELVRRNQLDAYCVRCWPELRNLHKLTPCVAHALLSQDGIPNSCEVDLPALIATYILNRLAGTPAFNFDITAYLPEQGAIQFAHCGAAAPSLAGNAQLVTLRAHMRTGTGATVEFPFQEGTATLAKLLRPRDGRLRLFVCRCLVVQTGDGVRGSVATVRPEPSAEAFLDTMMRDAVEHHVALVYGDWTRELRHFCEFTGVEYFS
jgi:L-fucose isomerase-like protein